MTEKQMTEPGTNSVQSVAKKKALERDKEVIYTAQKCKLPQAEVLLRMRYT